MLWFLLCSNTLEKTFLFQHAPVHKARSMNKCFFPVWCGRIWLAHPTPLGWTRTPTIKQIYPHHPWWSSLLLLWLIWSKSLQPGFTHMVNSLFPDEPRHVKAADKHKWLWNDRFNNHMVLMFKSTYTLGLESLQKEKQTTFWNMLFPLSLCKTENACFCSISIIRFTIHSFFVISGRSSEQMFFQIIITHHSDLSHNTDLCCMI